MSLQPSWTVVLKHPVHVEFQLRAVPLSISLLSKTSGYIYRVRYAGDVVAPFLQQKKTNTVGEGGGRGEGGAWEQGYKAAYLCILFQDFNNQNTATDLDLHIPSLLPQLSALCWRLHVSAVEAKVLHSHAALPVQVHPLHLPAEGHSSARERAVGGLHHRLRGVGRSSGESGCGFGYY